jgi:dsDNA-specific endonuclease/ATPase MutS2
VSPWLLALIFLAVVVLLWWSSRSRPAPAPPDDEGEALDAAAAEARVGVVAIEDALDLHGFQPREIPEVVESYLEAAAAAGLTEVRLIHGRGKGVQRRRVQEILASHPLVERFVDAPGHRGGWGATIAWLRRTGEEAGLSSSDEQT